MTGEKYFPVRAQASQGRVQSFNPRYSDLSDNPFKRAADVFPRAKHLAVGSLHYRGVRALDDA